MYERVEGVVRLDGKLSNAFIVERGVKRGGSLSPLLFISFMDEVLKICKRRTERPRVGYWNTRPVCCQALLYADDRVNCRLGGETTGSSDRMDRNPKRKSNGSK
jgi:hypothetical protein